MQDHPDIAGGAGPAAGTESSGSSSQAPSGGAQPGESEANTLNRNLNELLQELRVSEVGVQILFAFLLTLPFTQRFSRLGSFERYVYFATLMIAVASSALFIAPAAFHRIVFRHHERAQIVAYASRLLIAGLTLLMLALAGAVLVVNDFLFGSLTGAIACAGVVLFCAVFWYLVPLLVRARHRRAHTIEP